MRNRIFLAAIKLVMAAPAWGQGGAVPSRSSLPAAVSSAKPDTISGALQAGLAAHRRGDFSLALEKLIPLANTGNATAQFQLGVMNEAGQGVPPNARRAVARYRQAADQGNADAQYRLGEKYDLGLGVERDKKIAAEWYAKSAAQGNAQAKAKLDAEEQTAKKAVAEELAYWNNVQAKQAEVGTQAPSRELAVAAELAYWDKAAPKVQPERSALQIGLEAFQKGDYPIALERLIPLANKGDAAAQLQLGVMNELGLGVPKNAQRAVLRYRQSADQGNVEAQYRLGDKYHIGLGVAQDKKVAMEWMKKSAAQGYEKARDFIDEETNKAEHLRLAAEANERAAKAALADEQAKQAAALQRRAEAEQARAASEAKAAQQARLDSELKAKADAEVKKAEQARIAAEEKAKIIQENKLKAEIAAKTEEAALLAKIAKLEVELKARTEAEAKKAEAARLAAEAKAAAMAKAQQEAKLKADTQAELEKERIARQEKLAAESKAKLESKAKRTEQSLPEPPAASNLAATSLPGEMIERRLMDWATAWSSKNVRDYFSSYAPDYHPEDKSREAWYQQRTERIKTPKMIDVKLTNIRVDFLDEGHASATFKQAYRSDSYRDQVEKMLKLEKRRGSWLIVEEKSME
jgi:TPR repeat protein